MKLSGDVSGVVSGQRNTLLLVSAVLLIFLSYISSSRDISLGLAGNVIAFSSYLFFVGVFISLYPVFEVPRKPVLAFGLLHILFVVGFVRDVTGSIHHSPLYIYPVSDTQLLLQTAEVIGYIIASITLVFLIPKVIRRDWFFVAIVSLSTLSVVVGLPAYVIGDYNIFGINITTYTALKPLRQYDIWIPALASIWGDANAMSKVTVGGLLGSHYLFSRKRSKLYLLLIGLNGLGLFLANSTMAIISVMIAYSLYFVYLKFGILTTVVYMGISGVAGSIFFLLIIFGVGTQSVVPTDAFSGRILLWKGSMTTFFQHPFIGIGIHNVGETIAAYTDANSLAPQNSHLRIFVAGGIIGGITYLWVIISSAFRYIQKIDSRADLLTVCLLIAFILIQFTDTAHPFGVNKNAIIFGVTLGYVIDRVYSPRSD
jgi:hypothetical protein